MAIVSLEGHWVKVNQARELEARLKACRHGPARGKGEGRNRVVFAREASKRIAYAALATREEAAAA
jgi:hypothetical protein